jgi:signal transduction histidine kinase
VHDELGQALTGCKLDLSWIAGRLPREQKELIAKTRALSTHIDSTIQMVRRIATELRPGILDHLGLAAALEWQANEFQTRTGIQCEVHASLQDTDLTPELNTTFFRIFQETLTNVIRHAGATQVKVELRQRDDKVILDVRDNGRGISRAEINNTKSMGLLGMRERAALLGGEFKISRLAGGEGTRVTVSSPLPHQTREQETNHANSFSRRSHRRATWAEANSR